MRIQASNACCSCYAQLLCDEPRTSKPSDPMGSENLAEPRRPINGGAPQERASTLLERGCTATCHRVAFPSRVLLHRGWKRKAGCGVPPLARAARPQVRVPGRTRANLGPQHAPDSPRSPRVESVAEHPFFKFAVTLDRMHNMLWLEACSLGGLEQSPHRWPRAPAGACRASGIASHRGKLECRSG